jgi:hypothetical protein
LYDKEKVDLETIVIDDVFKLLQCDENGLSRDEAHRRLELFGPNKLEVEEQNAFLQVCHICLRNFHYDLSLFVSLFSSSALCGILYRGSWKLPPL